MKQIWDMVWTQNSISFSLWQNVIAMTIKNKWRGVTMSLRTGGQGHPIPIHTSTHPPHANLHKKYQKRSFSYLSTWWTWRTNGWTDGQKVACPQLKSSSKVSLSVNEPSSTYNFSYLYFRSLIINIFFFMSCITAVSVRVWKEVSDRI